MIFVFVGVCLSLCLCLSSVCLCLCCGFLCHLHSDLCRVLVNTQMKTAVLISGQLRTFKKCYPTQKWQIFRHYEPDIHFFVSCVNDDQVNDAALITRDYENVSLECYDDPVSAITREKDIKKWRRDWKIGLIEKGNPDWLDRYDDIAQ